MQYMQYGHKKKRGTKRKEKEKAMWAYESVFYQIYPLGFCGAPFENSIV